MPIRGMNFAGSIHEERPAARFPIVARRRTQFELCVIFIGSGHNPITKLIPILAPRCEIFIDERGLLRRNLILGRRAELRERFR